MGDEQERVNQVVVFRTGKLWEFDLARDALKQHDIPFFARTDSVSGVRTALGVMPTPGPGVFWCLVVPETEAQRAREILQRSRLRVEKHPLIWDFAPSLQGKRFWKGYVWFILILGALFLLITRILVYR